MKKRYCIGLVIAVILVLAALSGASYANYNYQKKLAESVPEEEPKVNPSVAAQGSAQKEELYYLKRRNGYVVVYQDDQKSIYEYTNIRMEDLPKELQEEIEKGKWLEGKDKLYGFLENYSS